MVKLLLDRGANIEAVQNDGHTPLFAAAHYGHLETLQYLVKRGADTKHRNDLGQTALHLVAHKCKKHSEEIIGFLVEHGIEIDEGDSKGYSALNFACYFGRPDTMRCLLELGANVEFKGGAGFTPLLSATIGVRPKIMRSLLQEYGARWDVEANGPETIIDIVARAKVEWREWRASGGKTSGGNARKS